MMKKDKGQIALIMIIASIAALSIIIATTTSTTSSTRTLAIIKHSQINYEEALFINDYICGKFQEYVGSDSNKLKNIYEGQNYYKNKITTYFNEALNIINNCNLNSKDIAAPNTITVDATKSISGYYDNFFDTVYNHSKIIRYKYNMKINGKYRNIILEIGIIKISNSSNDYYNLSYSTSFLYNQGGI